MSTPPQDELDATCRETAAIRRETAAIRRETAAIRRETAVLLAALKLTRETAALQAKVRQFEPAPERGSVA